MARAACVTLTTAGASGIGVAWVLHIGLTYRMPNVTSRKMVATAAVCAALWLSAPTAHAGSHPADVFKGQIITAKKSIPTKAASQAAYVKEVKKLKATQFQEDKEKKSWKIYFAAFFAKALNDLEVTIKLYD